MGYWGEMHSIGSGIRSEITPGWAALEVLVCAGYRLQPVPVQAWRFSLRWWVWGLCCRPLQSSCSRSTACPLARQTQSTSHQTSHLSSATQRGSVSASHTSTHTGSLYTSLHTHPIHPGSHCLSIFHFPFLFFSLSVSFPYFGFIDTRETCRQLWWSL